MTNPIIRPVLAGTLLSGGTRGCLPRKKGIDVPRHIPLSTALLERIEQHQDLRRAHRRHGGPPTPNADLIEEADLAEVLLFGEGVDRSGRLAQAIERHGPGSPHAQRLLRHWQEWRDRYQEMTAA